MIKKLYHKFKRWMDWHPPAALSMDGWCQFNREFKETAPIRYWFHTDFKRIFVYPVTRKYKGARAWIIYRTSMRMHVLPTGCKPGWMSADERIICANFQVLVDLVECRYASQIYYWSDEFKNISKWDKLKNRLPFRPRFRSRKLGMEHLDWASKLDDPTLPVQEQSPRQAVAAREIRALYIWWKDERDKYEPDPALPRYEKQKSFDDIDTEMLIRLIKIRQELDD